LITGANSGIGWVTARELCRRGARVFSACRSLERAEESAARIRAEVPAAQLDLIQLDLGDFSSVRRGAEAFLAQQLPLHILINNAGLAGRGGLSASGFELAFGVNHMGHFLLTQLLLDRIRTSAPARIVTVASRAHKRVRAEDLDWVKLRSRSKAVTKTREYGVSKLANVLFSAELARKLQGSGVNTYSLHPGVVATEVWREIPWPVGTLLKRFMITAEEGALTTLHCATSSAVANESGLYYSECRAVEPSALARDPALAAELWRRSEAWIEPSVARGADVGIGGVTIAS
jgi:NAD(P)-dependent dehydrogenase (short-subunit alcohol dehydrogenase family)